MDAATAEKKPAPYGTIGLCVSTVVAIAIAVVLMAATAGSAYLAIVILHGQAAAKASAAAILAALEANNEFGVAPLGLGTFFYAAALIAIVLVALWRGGKHWRDLIAWRPPLWPVRDKVLWILAAVGLVYGLVSSAALGYFYPKSNTWLLIPRDPVAAGLLLVMAAIMAPVAEETYFRGWIFTSLRQSWGRWPAIVVSALLFGLAHYESTHLYALAVFPLGLVLAGLRERTGSAGTSMLFHAANNLIAFLSASMAGS
ncbi:MAG: CPBP family intramembrane glutamic endopeptidase [Pseudomonadota bacterium]